METYGNSKFKGLSYASFVGSALTLVFGLDKMFRYHNGEWGDPHNAYVGGDAYNYIINGNYATGFFVLTAALALMGVGFLALWYLSKMSDMQENYIATYHAEENTSSNSNTPDITVEDKTN